MTDMTPNTTDHFSAERREVMRLAAGAIIPPNPAREMPGADDPAILDDILASAGRDADALARALDILGAGGAPHTDEALAQFRRDHPALADVVSLVIAQCYYRDTRVLVAIGVEPRAPFPKGYDVAQGDWSLLDPVRERGPIYREVKNKESSA